MDALEGYKIPPGQVCRLKKSLYGLKQASRQWNQEFTDKIKAYGFMQSSHDHCLFVKGSGLQLIALLVYVDDILVTTPTEILIQEIKGYLDRLFSIKDLGPAKYFLGLELARSPQGLIATQNKYALDIIKDVGLLQGRSVTTPLPPGLKFGTESGRALQDPDWAACPLSRRSLTGYCIFLGISPVSWKTKKQTTAARSSAEAEYRSMAATTCEITWVTNVLQDLGVRIDTPVPFFCDNKAALHITANPVFHERTKHVEIDCHVVRDKYKEERDRVLERCSWAYDKQLLVLAPVDVMDDPTMVDINCLAEHDESASMELPGSRAPLDNSDLRSLIRDNNSSLVFLMKTKCSSRLVESLKRKFDMHGIGVQLLVRARAWQSLGEIGKCPTSVLFSESYRLVSDFNEILDNSEKCGGPLRLNWQMRNFRRALSDCDLHDTGFMGDPFTWSNRQLAPHTMYECLDRACANIGCSQMYSEASILHLPQTYSDHKVLSINLLAQAEGPQSWSRPLRFKAAWLQSDQCEKVASNSWGMCWGNSRTVGIAAQLEFCQQNLKRWSHKDVGGELVRVPNFKFGWILGCPRLHFFRPITTPTTALAHTLVSDLIDPCADIGKRTWCNNCFGRVIAVLFLLFLSVAWESRIYSQKLVLSRYIAPTISPFRLRIVHVPVPMPHWNQLGGVKYGKSVSRIRDCAKTRLLLRMQSVASQEPIQVATFATQFLDSFLHQAAASPSLRDTGTYSTWQAPSLDFVKINFDGAIFGREGAMGVGVVARNSQGQCLAWMAHRVPRAGDGELAEA
ncbi:UNVERIFIED_CONTAM: Retrovirus-related Pol polyprotein from transposon RE1 [Sesamum calycinum]|uniref:Retrovirus-related Pol polyprotein from transposon RE1 n=1 Tax=Sesamum calycinum TaxID=2727403 RepID=A0AAW2SU46_9LAMI